jgi:hypothetical protein
MNGYGKAGSIIAAYWHIQSFASNKLLHFMWLETRGIASCTTQSIATNGNMRLMQIETHSIATNGNMRLMRLETRCFASCTTQSIATNGKMHLMQIETRSIATNGNMRLMW